MTIHELKNLIDSEQETVKKARKNLENYKQESNYSIRKSRIEIEESISVAEAWIQKLQNLLEQLITFDEEELKLKAIEEELRIVIEKHKAAEKAKAEAAEKAKAEAAEKAKAETIQNSGRQFPPKGQFFVERKKPVIIKQGVETEESRIVAIYGPSGAGKTRLALVLLPTLSNAGAANRDVIDVDVIDKERAAFIDCAQIGFDNVFVRCLQKLAGRESWDDIEQSYSVLQSGENAGGNLTNKFSLWFPDDKLTLRSDVCYNV